MRAARLVCTAALAAAACVGDDGTWARAPAALSDGPLVADAGPAIHAIVGEPVVLDASASRGAVLYRWSFGDGRSWDAPRPEPRAEVVYDEPGRYQAVVAAYDDLGGRAYAATTVTVTLPATFAPSGSSTVAAIRGARKVAVVSPDSDEVSVFAYGADPGDFRLVRRHRVCDNPRTVTVWGDWLIVPCQDDDRIALVRHRGAAASATIRLPWGARPFGAAVAGDRAYVTLAGPGQLGELAPGRGAAPPHLVRRLAGVVDARAIAALPDGRLAVTRWRSPDDEGQVAIVDPSAECDDDATATLALPLDPTESTDSLIGGVPSYLAQVAVSPTGRDAVVPALQAAIHEGAFRADRPNTFETTVRGIAVLVDLGEDGDEATERDRLQFDNRGMTSAAAWTGHGEWLFVADRGARTVERLDPWSGDSAGSIQDVGFAPDGLALSDDDRWLFVAAYLSRELVVYDVSGDFGVEPEAVARLAVAGAEPLTPELLLGKQLFNDALDTRLGRDSYLACAHCHLDGESDHRIWDFTDRGEGLRNTTSLLGRAGTGHGPVHWSANFDEIQDFENDIRNAFKGTGLLTDEEFEQGTRSHPLGDAKAGLSPDLDALAAYVASLDHYPRSPYRTADGKLTAAARRGRSLFRSARLGCATCHRGAVLTDSGFDAPGAPRLHDVGTLGPGSGQRLGGPLSGIDTPTLYDLVGSAPYLHDGSAPDVHTVLGARNRDDRHGKTRHLNRAQLADLEAYLLSLDAAGAD